MNSIPCDSICLSFLNRKQKCRDYAEYSVARNHLRDMRAFPSVPWLCDLTVLLQTYVMLSTPDIRRPDYVITKVTDVLVPNGYQALSKTLSTMTTLSQKLNCVTHIIIFAIKQCSREVGGCRQTVILITITLHVCIEKILNGCGPGFRNHTLGHGDLGSNDTPVYGKWAKSIGKNKGKLPKLFILTWKIM